MAGAAQVGSSLPTQPREFNLEFEDKNKVSYFEKLLIKKYKDGTMTMQAPPRPAQTEIESDEEPEVVPVISEYNVFYDTEDTLPPGDTGADRIAATSDPMSRPLSSSVFVEELAPDNSEIVTVPQGENNEWNGRENGPQMVSPVLNGDTVAPETATEMKTGQMSGLPKATAPQAGSETTRGKGKNRSGSGRAKRSKGKEKQAGSDPQTASLRSSPQSAGETVKGHTNRTKMESASPTEHPMKQSDLLMSVKSAWANCSQSNHSSQQLGQFFLHGVEAQHSEEEHAKPQTPNSANEPFEFRLASTVWLPNSSTVQLEPEVSCDVLESDSIDALASVPTPRQSRDQYYNDTESDSEPENEREEFIQSRLGMVSDSVECLRSRPTSTCVRDLEAENEMDRDREDCEALDELAWELASTVECEGRLTRCEEDLDSLEDGKCYAATPTPVVNGGEGEMDKDMGHVLDMSEVISEFELYQQRLMEEDSDQEH